MDFLIAEDDKESVLAFQEKVLRERPEDISLAARVLEFHLKRKDRKMLVSLVSRFAGELKCSAEDFIPKAQKLACEGLDRIWTDNLDSFLFYLESSPKIEQVRRLLVAQDCPGALRVLKEVEAKEGDAKPVLMMLEKVFSCLKDSESEASVLDRLREIRVFKRANDS
ncbi:MAG: hypothetical protein JST16_16255 [Bdellovibrionales bacterium]|nr:hypothetical protein [Bdellovibrionales bacterium]